MTVSAEPLRVAIAGCHRMLTRHLEAHNWASAFDAVPETPIVAVFDRGDATRREFQRTWRADSGEIPAYDDFGRMLSGARPDIVCIATRQTVHAQQIEAAVEAGVRGILCDKPLATTLDEADRIYQACKGAGVPLAFGLHKRWSASYRRLSSLLREGIAGDVEAVLAYGLPNLINHGCHNYDAALALAGDAEPVRVSGEVLDVSAEPVDSRPRLDPSGRAMVELSSGVRLTFLPEGGNQSFGVLGTAGRLLALNDADEVYLWEADAGGRSIARQPRMVEMPPPASDWPEGPAAVRDLVNAVRSGGDTACDVEEARRATEIGFAVHASDAADGARVALPLADRTHRIESFPWGNE